MAKRNLNIVIDCGEKTCASKPGEFCSRLLVTRMGTQWVCGAFLDEQCNNVELREDRESGWLQRCDQCLEAEQKVPVDKVARSGISVGDKVLHVLDEPTLEPYVVVEIDGDKVNVTSKRDPDRWLEIEYQTLRGHMIQ
jgi:hypothetical protein